MNSFDTNVLLWFNGFVGTFQPFDDLMRILASDYLLPLGFSLSMFGMWFAGRTRQERWRNQMSALVGISSIGLSNVVVWLINITWTRPRPFVDLSDQISLLFYHSTDPSFPANPVAIGFAAGAAAWMANRRFGYWLMAIAGLYGFSRMYAGVFYPTDIVAGAATGIAVTWGTTYLRRLVAPAPEMFIRLARGLGLG